MQRSTLIVGYDSFALVVLRYVLANFGRKVRIASNGTTALELMASEPSSVVIIDGDPRDFSGVNLANHMKALAEVSRPSQQCRTIAIRDARQSAELNDISGFDYVLGKPLQHEHIMRAVEQCEEALLGARS